MHQRRRVLQQAIGAPAARLELFQAYLAALCDADGGARLHAMLAPEAVVRSGSTLRPRRLVDAPEFARSHAELVQQGHSALPLYRNARLAAAAESADADGRVVWFEVDEARAGRSILVGVGFEGLLEGTRIGWSIVSARVESWTYRQGFVRSLCDYTWMGRTQPAQARLLIDASYFRAFPRSDERIDTLEGARFSCHMSSVCCRIDFEIVVDPAAQLIIDAIPWAGLEPRLEGTRLSLRPDGRLQLKIAGEPCLFLGQRRQCLVHQAIGIQPFATCAIYPYAFARTPEGVAVAMSTICPSARAGRGAPPLQNRADLLDRLAQAEPRQTEQYRLAPGHPVAWEIFRDVEQALLACLKVQDLPLSRRLYLGTRILGAARDGEPLRAADWLAEPLPALAPDLRSVLRGMLEKIIGWERPSLQALPRALPSQLSDLPFDEPEVLSRIVQNMLYSKSYSYTYDLTTAFNFSIVLFLQALLMKATTPAPLTDLQWQDLSALGVHGMLKQMLHEGVPEDFRALMGAAHFGQWLLAL